jgi:ankyrin repeat protein
MSDKVFEFYINQISSLFKKEKYEKGLELCTEMKSRLLANEPVDPVMLGWQRFYHFVHLVQLHKDEDALNLFLTNEEHPFSLDFMQMTYMTSLAAELACNLGNTDQTLKLARLSWTLSFKEKDMISRIQKAQNACIYFERLKQNRLNFGFSRFLTGFGKSNEIPVLYIQGLECILANFLQSQSKILLAILYDSMPTLAEYLQHPPDKLEAKRILELIEAIEKNKRSYAISGFYDKAHGFIINNRLAELRSLLNEFPDLVYESDEEGITLMFEAVRNGNGEAVEILLNHNADVHVIEDRQGSTPLLMAINTGHVDIARLLLNAGADPEIKGLFGQTPIIRAVIEGHHDLLGLLLEYGVMPDRKDESGNTAIMHAIEDGRQEMVKCLIFAGADTREKNSAGMTLLQIAESMGHESLVALLKQLNA